MFHISKQNVAMRMQVKHLLIVNSLEIIWSSFWLIIMNKLLRKPVLVRKSLFYLFRHWFLTLCFFLTKETSHSNMFLQRKLSEMNLSLDVFIILHLSRSVHLHPKWFSRENKERKATLLQETQADQVS